MTSLSALATWFFGRAVVTSVVLLYGVLGAFTPTLSGRQLECRPTIPRGPLFITPACSDPAYGSIVIDSEAQESYPRPHRKVSAHFNGTSIAIRVYLPPKGQWDNRFYHYVYPSNEADATNEHIHFAIDSRAYFVQITGTNGYRADAAAAKFSRVVASQYYNVTGHIYGYIFGGSGGSFQTIGAVENTAGVWDGSVPIIQAVPISLPNNIAARALAGLVLADKSTQIVDAIRPGGNGDPFSELNEVEYDVLQELTRLGVPLQSWEDFEQVAKAASLVYLINDFITADPTYKTDFFTKPGYLGTEDSPLGDLIRAAWVNYTVPITNITRTSNGEPTILAFGALPTIVNPHGVHALNFTLYDSSGATEVGTLYGTFNTTNKFLYLSDANDQTMLEAICSGCRIHMDNSWFIAMSSYHRHQVPSRSGFYGFDQFRDAGGRPIPIQRSKEIGPELARYATGGGTHTGDMTGKMIVLDNLLDSDAYPYHADWYRTQVMKALGDGFSDYYRLYYSESANHDFGSVPASKTNMLVDFTGIIEQALRDLAKWTEDGILPPNATSYTVEGSQVKLPQSAVERRGFQPVVSLTVNGSQKAEVYVGEPVVFDVHVEVPPGTGKVVSIEFDPLGTGKYAAHGITTYNETADITVEYQFNATGTYFPGIRVISQRDGDPTTLFGRVKNLGRARVVVTQGLEAMA